MKVFEKIEDKIVENYSYSHDEIWYNWATHMASLAS